MRIRLNLAGSLAAIAVIILAGCGGGGRLSLVDFEAKANGICTKYNAKIRAAYAGTPQDPASLALAIQKALGYAEKGNSELDKLKPPQSDDAQYKQFLNVNHEEIPTGKEIAAAAKVRDQARLAAAVTKLRLEGANADRLARELGLNACAQH